MTADDRFYVWTIICVAATAIGIGWAGAWVQSKKYEAEARACECAPRDAQEAGR